MKIGPGSHVTIELAVHDVDGELILSTDDEGPIEYVQGDEDFLLPGLERALEGKDVGAAVEVTLEPEDAFGEYDYECLVSVPRSKLPPDAEVVPGDVLPVHLEDDSGGEMGEFEMRIHAIEGDSIVLDANHVLAGKRLRCRATVLDVRSSDA